MPDFTEREKLCRASFRERFVQSVTKLAKKGRLEARRESWPVIQIFSCYFLGI